MASEPTGHEPLTDEQVAAMRIAAAHRTDPMARFVMMLLADRAALVCRADLAEARQGMEATRDEQ